MICFGACDPRLVSTIYHNTTFTKYPKSMLAIVAPRALKTFSMVLIALRVQGEFKFPFY